MRLSGWHLPVEHVSASALTLGMQCPEQYRRKHIKKMQDTFHSDRLVGIVDHELFETAMTWKLNGVEMGVEQIEETYARLWKHTLDKQEGKGLKIEWKGNPTELFDLGVKMAKTYHEEVGKDVIPVKVEERFEFRLPGLPVPIIGYIDTQTHRSVLERKTAKSKVSKPKPGWRFQGRVYQLAADLPVEWHVITKQVTPQVCTPESTNGGLFLNYTDKDETVRMIVQAASILNEHYARYGPEGPWPTTGTFHDWLCDYCAFGPKYGGSCVAWQ